MKATVSTLLRLKNLAIVGLSDKPTRPSYQVAQYLQQQGYRIVPVNPSLKSVLGCTSYPTICAIPTQVSIDVVVVFRDPAQVISVLDDVYQSGRRPVVWLQEGVGSEAALQHAQKLGLETIMDLCFMKEHKKSLR